MKYIPLSFGENTVSHSALSKIYITPSRIVHRNEKVRNADYIINSSADLAALAQTKDITVLMPGGSILIDFGKELCGGLKLVTELTRYPDGKTAKECSIRISFGESANEAMADIGQKGACNDHAPRDIPASIGCFSMSEIGYTGFRFARIQNTDAENSLELKSVIAYAYFRDIEYKGSFHSSDEQLNKIFDTAAYTLHLCMQDYIWDGVKRDRHVWIGDMYPEIAALCSVFGFDDSVEKSLDLALETTPDGQYMNGIVTYSAWWILVQHRWYMQNGRYEYLKSRHDAIVNIIKLMSRHISSDGNFAASGRCLFDWPSWHDGKMSATGIHSVVKMMFDAAEYLLCELGDEDNAKFCRECAAVMSKAVFPDFDYKQISAMHVMSGLRDAETENRRLLSKNGAYGISTFLGMFTFAARALAGDAKSVLSDIKGLYGKMLDIGATSFWEDFDPDWCENAGRIDELTSDGLEDIHGDRGAYCYIGFRHSLCHGWSAGVCAYLSEYVLGVKIKAPACRQIEISACPDGLDFVEGTYPTPFGKIFVRHEKNSDGTYKTTYSAPKEIQVKIK